MARLPGPFVLVIDVGTTSVIAALVDGRGRLSNVHSAPVPPSVHAPGLIEFNPSDVARKALGVARQALAGCPGAPVAVGIANQRCSTLAWRRSSGEPTGPGLGWADLRTAGMCLELQAHNLRLAPNQTATKASHLLALAADEDADDLCVGTLDSWLVWHLSEGAEHVTDATNAAIGGLCKIEDGAPAWDSFILDRLGIPQGCLPRIVDSSGELALASALDGSPPVMGIAGDQQASLIGSGCVRRGDVKITFGTGGMLDMTLGADAPAAERCPGGSFPIAAWQREGRAVWGIEAMMLGAGSCVDWFCALSDALDSPEASDALASGCGDSAGVVFLPLLDGLGAPRWDFGARGRIAGVTTATRPAHLARALLDGLAQRGVDLIETAESDSGIAIEELSIDGGMSANPTFAQALADCSGRIVSLAPEVECTALGAAYLAGVAAGVWPGLEEAAALRPPRAVLKPQRDFNRARWRGDLERCAGWHPELSAISF